MFDNIKSPDTRKQKKQQLIPYIPIMFNKFKQFDCSFHMFLGKNEKHVFSPKLRPEIPLLSQLQSNLWNDHPIEMCFKTSKIIKHLHVVLGWNMLKHIFFPIVNGFPIVSHVFPIVNLVSHAFPMVFLYGSYGFPMVWTPHFLPWKNIPCLRAGPGQHMRQVVQVKQPLGHLGRRSQTAWGC